MTRWILLALAACASAQNVDRHEEATNYLEKAAKAQNSPILSALALKMATAEEGSALTKVVKFIDEAYNNIQNQIEKETAEHARCNQETAKNQAAQDKTDRTILDLETAEMQAEEAMGKAKQEADEAGNNKNDAQNERTNRYNRHKDHTEQYNVIMEDLTKNRQQLVSIATTIKNQASNAASADMEGLDQAAAIFNSMTARVQEHIDESKKDHQDITNAYRLYTQQDDRDMVNYSAIIKKQVGKAQTNKEKAASAAKSLRAERQTMAQHKELRKQIDSECIKTEVSHEERSAKRQAEIDSLKSVKEILETSGN